MYFGTLYTQAQNQALRAMRGSTKIDLLLLQCLSFPLSNYSYGALYDTICLEYGVISKRSYQQSINRLVGNHNITRNQVGLNVVYAITTDGIKTIEQFNYTIDHLVKIKISKYGNGFNADQ